MNHKAIRFLFLLGAIFSPTPHPANAASREKENDVEGILKRVEGYFVIQEDRKGFQILDESMEKFHRQPEEGEFLYAKAVELVKHYRSKVEQEEGRKLLMQYLERFPEGHHLGRALTEVAPFLSVEDQETSYRMLIRRPNDSQQHPWALERLAALLDRKGSAEAGVLRRRIIDEHPRSAQAYRALGSLAREDVQEGRLEEAAKKLEKCLFEFTHLNCSQFEDEESLLSKIAEGRPDLRLEEGAIHPEYTPRWKEGEGWELLTSPLPPKHSGAVIASLEDWKGLLERSALYGQWIDGSWSYLPRGQSPRTILTRLGPSEERKGKLCYVIHCGGEPFAYSPELTLYIRQNDLELVEARQGDRNLDPFSRMGSSGWIPFLLPQFPLKIGKAIFKSHRHRIVQECSLNDGKAVVRLTHCDKTAILLFPKNPIWWEEAYFLTQFYPSAMGPGIPVPMVCRMVRSSRSDPSMNLDAELSAISLVKKIEKAFHDRRIREMESAGEELLSKYPEHGYCSKYLKILGGLASDPASRKAAFERLARDYPNSPEAEGIKKQLIQGLEGRERIQALRRLAASESDPRTALELSKLLLYALTDVKDYQSVVDEFGKMASEAGKWSGDRWIQNIVSEARWPAAMAFYQTGQYEKSLELYEALPRARHIVKACALVKLGRFQEAMKACQMDGSRASEILQSFIWHGLGEKKKAARLMKRAAFDRLDPQVLVHLGLLYEEMGNEEEAFRIYDDLRMRYPDTKVFTDLTLRLFKSENPRTTVGEFCSKKLGSSKVPSVVLKTWNLSRKHLLPSIHVKNIFLWDLEGDGDLELFVAGSHDLQVYTHDLELLWEIGELEELRYMDFRPSDQKTAIFAYSRSYSDARSQWIDEKGNIALQLEYRRKYDSGRLSMESEEVEFPYAFSGKGKIVATRRKVFLRRDDGTDIWSFALGGVPEKKGSDHGLWPAPPAVQDVRVVDLDGDTEDEFLVIVEQRDICRGMVYYLGAVGGGLVLLDGQGKPQWEHNTGTVRRISFCDCTGNGQQEVLVEADGLKILSCQGRLLAEENPRGFDLGDFDGDGTQDLFLCTPEGIQVKKLNGKLLLEVGFLDGRGVAWGDVSGDGSAEITAVTDDQILVIDTRGKLIFSSKLEKRGILGVLVGDHDGDGKNSAVIFGKFIGIYDLIQSLNHRF